MAFIGTLLLKFKIMINSTYYVRLYTNYRNFIQYIVLCHVRIKIRCTRKKQFDTFSTVKEKYLSLFAYFGALVF